MTKIQQLLDKLDGLLADTSFAEDAQRKELVAAIWTLRELVQNAYLAGFEAAKQEAIAKWERGEPLL